VLESSELACTICHEGLMEPYRLIESTRRNRNVKFVERAIDRFADAFEKRIEVVANGWERVLRILTEYSCPSSLLQHLIHKITSKTSQSKGLQERLLRILDECVFRNDFDRTPRTRISMLCTSESMDIDNSSSKTVSFANGTLQRHVKATNVLSPTKGHTICFWLRLDGADPDLFRSETRSYEYRCSAALRSVSLLTIRSNEKPYKVLYRIEIEQGAIRVRVSTRDVYASSEKILLPNRWHWIVISHTPPEIEKPDADCRINLCVDNAIYGLAALPYPVKSSEKASREMADMVFGSKDDWQEDDDSEDENLRRKFEIDNHIPSSRSTVPVLKKEDRVRIVLGKVSETRLMNGGMSSQHMPTLDVGYGAIYTHALTEKEAIELRPESMMMREHVCHGGFPFPHVSNFIVRPNTFDNSDSSTNSWTSNRKGTRVACYHTYSGVESLISLGGTFFFSSVFVLSLFFS